MACRNWCATVCAPASRAPNRLLGPAQVEHVGGQGVALDLQQVHPARIGHGRARVCWGAGGIQNGVFFDRSLRVDLDSGAVTTWQRPGAVHLEPLFVPRPGGSADDDGVLLVPTLADDDDASVIGVVDAATMRGLAEIRAPQVLPFGFHAAFMPA